MYATEQMMNPFRTVPSEHAPNDPRASEDAAAEQEAVRRTEEAREGYGLKPWLHRAVSFAPAATPPIDVLHERALHDDAERERTILHDVVQDEQYRILEGPVGRTCMPSRDTEEYVEWRKLRERRIVDSKKIFDLPPLPESVTPERIERWRKQGFHLHCLQPISVLDEPKRNERFKRFLQTNIPNKGSRIIFTHEVERERSEWVLVDSYQSLAETYFFYNEEVALPTAVEEVLSELRATKQIPADTTAYGPSGALPEHRQFGRRGVPPEKIQLIATCVAKKLGVDSSQVKLPRAIEEFLLQDCLGSETEHGYGLAAREHGPLLREQETVGDTTRHFEVKTEWFRQGSEREKVDINGFYRYDAVPKSVVSPTDGKDSLIGFIVHLREEDVLRSSVMRRRS